MCLTCILVCVCSYNEIMNLLYEGVMLKAGVVLKTQHSYVYAMETRFAVILSSLRRVLDMHWNINMVTYGSIFPKEAEGIVPKE